MALQIKHTLQRFIEGRGPTPHPAGVFAFKWWKQQLRLEDIGNEMKRKGSNVPQVRVPDDKTTGANHGP